MVNFGSSMKDVVAELRREAPAALFDLLELEVAVGELALSAGGLSAAVRELALQARHIADNPAALASATLQAFASHANNTSSNAEAHARALAEVKHGLIAWSAR